MKEIKYALFLFAVAMLMLFVMGRGTAKAEDYIFETSAVRLVIDESGIGKSLQERMSRRELLFSTPVPFFSVRRGGKWSPVTKLVRQGDLFKAEFGQSGMSADFRISPGPDRIVIELARLAVTGAEEVRFAQLRQGVMPNSGESLTVSWDSQTAFGLLGLSDKVDSRFGEGMLLASVYPEFGMIGEKVALVAVPTQQFTAAVQRLEKEFRLPSPTINGVWAKSAPDVRTSYLFTDLTETNADETIRYAKLAGFKYILVYSHIWASSNGSYPINVTSFPRGEASLKAVIDKCHEAGIKVGMHMMTSFVGKDDTFARSRTQDLFSDAEQVLAKDISNSDREISAAGALIGLTRSMYEISYDVRIDNEIIHYEAIGGPGSTMLLRCTRGYAGTKPAPHKAGTKIQHLAEYYGSYLADLKTSLKDTITERIAGLIDRCGFDMIFFDGENCINGPCWYWGGRHKTDIMSRVKRDLLVEGSGMSHWAWHISTRGNCDDFAAVAPKQYLDHHKINHWWNYYSRSFMPAELGWWGFLSTAPDHPATTPDEAELYAVRMLALDTPVSIETTLAVLRSNGRAEEMLKLLGEYEQLRLSDAIPEQVRKKLLEGEWHLEKRDGRPQFIPVRYETARPGGTGEVLVKNEFAPQKLKFRLQAGPGLTKVGDRSNITLLPPGSPLLLSKPGPAGVSPGMLAGRILFTQMGADQPGLPLPVKGSSMVQGGSPKNLTAHRALALKVNVEGTLPKRGEKGAVLNVQLESGGFYRDHFIALDFTGERTIIVTEPNPEKMLPELRPSFTAYSMKSALLGFDYKNIVSINFRWMRQPRANPLLCTVTLVEALAETDAILKDPEITVGTSRVVIPVELKTGEYVEYWGEGRARIFDRNGVQLTTTAINDTLTLETGDNMLIVNSKGSNASVKVTTTISGTALQY